jgi:hypothetical protein
MTAKRKLIVQDVSTDKKDNLLVYNEDDYAGDLNLRVAEKVLILEAALRFTGYRALMTKELGLLYKPLQKRITAHGLDSFLWPKGNNEMIQNEISRLKRGWPLVFMAPKEYDAYLDKRNLSSPSIV